MATMKFSVMARTGVGQAGEDWIYGTKAVYRQCRPYRHCPGIAQAQLATLHRIFFGHQQRSSHRRKILAAIAMMIGEGMLANRDAEHAQRFEEPARIADPSHRVDAHASQRIERTRFAAGDGNRRSELQAHL